MNEISSIEKADLYIKHVQSDGEFQVSKSVLEMGERLFTADRLMMRYPKESDALKMYMQHTGLTISVARRDFSIAQYVFGKAQMPNRTYEIKKQLDRADKLYDYFLNLGKGDPIDIGNSIAKVIVLKNKVISMLPEEVPMPDMSVFKKQIRFSPDPAIIGKTKKDMAENKVLFEFYKRKLAPKLNFDHVATDAEIQP